MATPKSLPTPDLDDDFADDEDEQANLALESSAPQKLLWPLLILIAVAGLLALSFPLMYMLAIFTQRLVLGAGQQP